MADHAHVSLMKMRCVRTDPSAAKPTHFSFIDIHWSTQKSSMPAGTTEPRPLQPTILSFVRDLPNLCSLAGLVCSVLAIYFAILGIFHAAMIAMIWAVAFDWGDGLIARRMKGRTGNDRAFGGQLDSLIDVVNYGVAPAIVLMSFTHFNPAFLIVAFLMIAASTLRLSYFNTFGFSGGTHYTGLALDNNNIIHVFVFLFAGLFSVSTFSIALCISGLGIAALNLSLIHISEPTRRTIPSRMPSSA